VPKTLFKYPASEADENQNERTKVVKDFCFPNGILVIKLNYDADSDAMSDPDAKEII